MCIRDSKGGVHKLSRRDIDALTKYVAIYGAKGLAYFQTVSYTHLDVYKRQLFFSVGCDTVK